MRKVYQIHPPRTPEFYPSDVRIDRLTLHHFRNLHGLNVHPAPGINLVAGPNGHGKSNLLESLHFLCLAHSPRTRKDKDIIAWGQEAFVVRGEGTLGHKPHIQSVEYRDEGSRVKLGGGIGANESRKLSDLLGHFLLVAFTPEDLDILRGGPQERRRFLDLLQCQHDPAGLEILRRYRQAMRQRNAALRLNLRPEEEDLLSAYEATLAEAGAEIVLRRLDLVRKLAPLASEFYREIGEGGEALSLEMTKSLGTGENPSALRENFLQKLHEKRFQDRENGLTSVGPHRDDLLAFLNEKPVRDFASQGQKRSVALALKLASSKLLEEASGMPPILLLDDVFAELDPGRRERFGALIAGHNQVFIATPRREDLPFVVDQIFNLEHGQTRDPVA
jgi:DNA replication and repair protein RecF